MGLIHLPSENEMLSYGRMEMRDGILVREIKLFRIVSRDVTLPTAWCLFPLCVSPYACQVLHKEDDVWTLRRGCDITGVFVGKVGVDFKVVRREAYP